MQKVTVSFSVDLPNGASVLACGEAMRHGAQQELRRVIRDDVSREEPAVVVHTNSLESWRDDGGGGLLGRR